MTFAYTTDAVVTPTRNMFYRAEDHSKKTIPATIAIDAFREDLAQEGLLMSNGFIPPGTPIGLANAGTYNGLWVPYLPNSAATEGEETWLATLWDPVYITRDTDGLVRESTSSGAIIPVRSEQAILYSKMPAVSSFTAFAGGAGASQAVTSADALLTDGIIDVEALGITGIAGI